MKKINKALFIAFSSVLLLLHATTVNATVFTVNSLADPGTGAGNSGSLRYCITQTNLSAGPHSIVFTGMASGGTITLAGDLPAITRADVTIDATTVSGYVTNQPGIHIDATAATNGLYVNGAPRVGIYGFEIYGATTGIFINGDAADRFAIGDVNKRNVINRCSGWQIQVTGADSGSIKNNYIGCDVTGTSGYATTGSGIYLVTGANVNTVGGAAAGEGNLIAGGTGAAVYIGAYFGASTDGSSGNIFYGNQFGGSGTDMPWWSWAFWIDGNSDNNVIGGVLPGQANVMRYATNGNSANGYGNLVIGINDVNADNNLVRGNDMRAAYGYGIVLASGGNNSQATPVITGQAGNVLSGTSTAKAVIDIYVGTLENSVYGQCKGGEYITSTTANTSGNWSVNLSAYGLYNDSNVVVTATDTVNGTSEFTDCFGPLSINAAQSSFCNNNGNVIIYSNYDGGVLNINVDQNIPNLKIGITTYEKTKVTFSGAYVGNITQVIYAGYNGQNNHCSPSPATTSITGVPANITTIYCYSPCNNLAQATLQNANGYPEIICNFTCDSSTNQGGCNTPDQIAHYFLSQFGGRLYYHFTQYPCWSGTYKVSDGGNCCIGANINIGCPVPSAAGPITGSTSVCQNQKGVTYSVAPILNATGYTWTLSGGATIASGNNTDTITVNFSSTASTGDIIVVGTNPCGNGISSSLSVTLNPAAVAGTINAVPDTICNGESSIFTVSGNSDTLHWQSSLTNGNFAGINGADSTSYSSAPSQTTYYRVYATKGLCSDTSPTVNLVVKPLPSQPVLAADDTLICASDSSHICASGVFNSYLWSNGDTTSCVYVKSAGGYWVTGAASNGCSNASGHLNIHIYPVQSVSLVVQGDTLASFNAIAYHWLLNGHPLEGDTSSIHVADQTGDYAVQITDSNGCTSLSNNVHILVDRIDEIRTKDEAVIFPNPFSTNNVELTITNGLIGSNLEVYDESGRIVFHSAFSIQHSSITLDVARGIYFLHISSSKAKIIRKLVKW